MRANPMLSVEVIQASPDTVYSVNLILPEGSVVADALAALGLDQDALAQQTAIYGKLTRLCHPLKEGDRIEVLRPLTVDPKQARRRRAARANIRTRR